MTGVIVKTDRRYLLGEQRLDCGVGACFEAVDAGDNRRVLVKLLTGTADTPALRSRFAAAGAALRTLSSPRVVRVLDAGWGDAPFLVLDAPKAQTLWRWSQGIIEAQTPVALTTVRRIVEELCHAVEAAHRLRAAAPLFHGALSAKSVLLLDAKPETLRLKVMDFGLSPFFPRGSGAEATEGALDTRAPEIVSSPDALTAPSDQFSIGVVLAALLTLPARIDVGPGWGRALLDRPEALDGRLKALRDDLRAGVREVLARALHPDAARRFESVEALRGALMAADWRPAERKATGAFQAVRRDARDETPKHDFERVWGEAWKERARLGVLPSALQATAPEPRVASVMRAPTKPAARGLDLFAEEDPRPTPVSPSPWSAPPPSLAQQTMTEEQGATIVDLDDGGSTMLDESTAAWSVPTRRAAVEVQTLVKVPAAKGRGPAAAADVSASIIAWRAQLDRDEREATMLDLPQHASEGDGSETIPVMPPKTISYEEAAGAQAALRGIERVAQPLPVRPAVSPSAWDVPAHEMTQPALPPRGPWSSVPPVMRTDSARAGALESAKRGDGETRKGWIAAIAILAFGLVTAAALLWGR